MHLSILNILIFISILLQKCEPSFTRDAIQINLNKPVDTTPNLETLLKRTIAKAQPQKWFSSNKTEGSRADLIKNIYETTVSNLINSMHPNKWYFNSIHKIESEDKS